MNTHSLVLHDMKERSDGMSYYMMPKAFLSAKEIYFNDERIEMSLTEKNVYMFMADQITFFKREYNSSCYYSHAQIAERLDMGVKQISRILNRFIEDGILIAEKINPRKWVYTDISSLRVIDYKGNSVIISKGVFDVPTSKQSRNTDTATKRKKSKADDFADLPF